MLKHACKCLLVHVPKSNAIPSLESFSPRDGNEKERRMYDELLENGAPSPMILTSTGEAIEEMSSTCVVIDNDFFLMSQE